VGEVRVTQLWTDGCVICWHGAEMFSLSFVPVRFLQLDLLYDHDYHKHWCAWRRVLLVLRKLIRREMIRSDPMT